MNLRAGGESEVALKSFLLCSLSMKNEGRKLADWLSEDCFDYLIR